MPLVAISLVSAGAIGYEILLMRLYSIGQWHHFAYMIISIALLGFGASGTFLALARAWLLDRFLKAWQANAVTFGVTAAFGYALARNFIVNPFELAWDPARGILLLWTYLVLMVPFFCAANCVGLAFMRFGDQVGRVYRYDLVGAGLGAAGVIGVLFLLPPSAALKLLIALGFAAAGIAELGSGHSRRRGHALLAALSGLLVAWLIPGSTFAPRLSEYKGLSTALNAPGAEVIHESSSPLGRLTVVRSPRVPFRHAPGLSLNAPAAVPEQLGLFTDADAMTAITRFDGNPRSVAYLDFTVQALPYHLLENPSVLVLGAGGGAEVLLARAHGAGRVEVAEPNPGVIALLQGRFAGFSGKVYDPARTTVYLTDARGALAFAGSGYDLIRLPLRGAAAGGFGALQATYGATVEAFVGYLGRLDRGGLLAVSVPIEVPPRAPLKLFATAIAALERMEAARPGRRLVLLRGLNTAILLVKRGDFSAAEIETARRFARERAFDLAYAPGLARAEANRFNVLDAPYLYDGAVALLGPGRAAFMADYKFDLRPASDDRPYFFDFLKWRALPELLALSRQGAMPLIAWGHLILLATLVQALVLSALLILAPLAVWHRRRGAPARGRARVAAYFLALGLAFLFVEIAFIQRLTLFLGHPLYAVAVVLAAFLVFAGLGAGLSPRLAARLPEDPATRGRVSALEAAVAAIAVIALFYLAVLTPVTAFLITLPLEAKLPLALAAIAPLAFCMGMPFPLALARVSREAPALVPWAWGINGCASVVSAVLATLLAIELGFTAVVGLAVALYVLAALVWRGRL
ncbi:MAG: SAM-dependent methyltransferase [Proteobacteria bacterium]|nr:SAM-dependent methyltransferase [Pseudomonadota bacterium]